MRASIDHRPNSKFLSELLVIALTCSPKGSDSARKTAGSAAAAGAVWAGLEAESQNKLQQLDRILGGELSSRLKAAKFKFEAGKRFDLPISPRLAAGVKKASIRQIRLIVFAPPTGTVAANQPAQNGEALEQKWRIFGGDTGQTAKNGSFTSIAVDAAFFENAISDPEAAVRLGAFVEGFHLGRYQFTVYKSRQKKNGAKEPAAPAVTFLFGRKAHKAEEARFKALILAAQRRAEAVNYCRDLVNHPPSDLHPGDLVKAARKAAAVRGSRITVKAFGRARLRALGANGILTVARGSAVEPFLVHAIYRPASRRKGAKRIVLVGKGVTFDSGGLSIKTGKGMEDMKCDMAGAAAVISVLKLIADSPAADRPIHEIHVLVPTVENLINENSVKPGDVFFALNGKSIEVLNTDAEGRLILADALSFAERLKADLIIDLATLTGACVAALGSDYAGLFSSDKNLEASLVATGRETGDQVWPLPLAKEYRPMITSSVADIQNIGPGGPGAITAALFLQEFVPAGVAWAHLDIAGPAFVTRGSEIIRPGGTGFGVRLLSKLVYTPVLPVTGPGTGKSAGKPKANPKKGAKGKTKLSGQRR